MALKVRDIFVRLGFEVDDADLTRLDNSLANIQRGVKGMTILFAGASIAIGGFLKVAGDFEQTEIAFETMLGNVEEAQQLLKDLADFATKTPFTLPGVESAARQLLGMGVESDKMIGTLKALGDVSAGLSVPLSRLALNYGQVKTQAKLTGRELRDFAIAGVPLAKVLAEQLGKSQAEITKLVSAGKIGFPEVEKAFISMSSEGGKFFNLMDRQAKSFLGIMSNIADVLIVQARAIGKVLLPQAKEIEKAFLDILEVNRKIIKARFVKFFKQVSVAMKVLFKVAVAVFEAIINLTDAFGGLGTVIKFAAFAMLGFTAISTLSALGGMAILVFKLIKGFKLLGVTISLMNATALLMPILIGAGLVALGLVVEDIIGFFQGKDSITGLIIEAFEKKLPEAFGITRDILFTIRDTFGVIVDETKLLFGFLNEFLLLNPLKSLSGIGDIKIGSPGSAGLGTLGNAFESGNKTSSTVVNLNAPITLPPLPPELSAEAAAVAIESGTENAVSGLMRQADRATSSPREF
jgi:tape measure domain-containing protein